MAFPDEKPEKVIITPKLIQEWEYDAGVLLDANCSDAEVIRDLRERGCTPLLAKQIVERAKGPVRTQHRIYGLTALGGGLLLLLMSWWSFSGSGFLHSHKLGIVELGAGALSVLVGAWKLLTGSAVDVETLVEGTAEDELDRGRR